MTDNLELVQFMTAEIGDDLIVSFFVAKPHDPTDGRSIILMLDKKWEHLVAESERGVTVSDEGFPENEEADNNYLEGIQISNTVAEIETTHRRYKLDLRHVGKSEVKAAMKVLKKMNYDRRFKLTVI
jgi:hypothetical protein